MPFRWVTWVWQCACSESGSQLSDFERARASAMSLSLSFAPDACVWFTHTHATHITQLYINSDLQMDMSWIRPFWVGFFTFGKLGLVRRVKSAVFRSASVSVPGYQISCVSDWASDFSPWASLTMEAAKETKFGTKLAYGMMMMPELQIHA